MIPRKYSLLWRNIIWAGVIFFLCAIPSDSIPDPKLNIPHLDKVVHFGMFFIMSIFLCSELRYQTRLSLQKIYLIAIGFSFIYGGLIEVLQFKYFNPEITSPMVSRTVVPTNSVMEQSMDIF